jgi:hypothetical protein
LRTIKCIVGINLLLSACAFGMGVLSVETVEVENLRCEYLENPLGIDVVQPRLSWRLNKPASASSIIFNDAKHHGPQLAEFHVFYN